jgi:hypothetical protein
LLAFRRSAFKLGYASIATAALTAWEWLQREEHLFGVFEIAHYRPKARPNSVCVVHPKTGEEAWWPLFDETGKELFPELDAIKEQTVSGLVFWRNHDHRRGRVPLPWITPRGGLDYLRATVKRIIRAAGPRDELSFTSFRRGGFTEGADSDLSDAELARSRTPPVGAAVADVREADPEAACSIAPATTCSRFATSPATATSRRS